ncbi:hypothetical protein Sjap_003859 [Stephania japonica]|uniref:GBF-interacting protein 1 N-terminal domain-containing protein n=1 Tax=Stephania japonica TaxID=461633 RepID=A0AAP0KRB3_9MAGN
MLKECSMDPNETAHKLLLQAAKRSIGNLQLVLFVTFGDVSSKISDPYSFFDNLETGVLSSRACILYTFHEVKRKRDKRKEQQLNNKDSTNSKWRSTAQGRGGRVGRGNQSSRSGTNDAGGGKIVGAGKENGVNQAMERGVAGSLMPVPQEIGSKATTPLSCSTTALTDGPINVTHGSSTIPCVAESLTGTVINPTKDSSVIDMNKLENAPTPLPTLNAKTSSSIVGIKQGQSMSNSDNLSSPVSVLGVYSSASDPVLVPSLDSRVPGTVGTIKREVGSQRAAVELNTVASAENKTASNQDFANHVQTGKASSEDVTESSSEDVTESSSMNEKTISEVGVALVQGKVPSKAHGVERSQMADTSKVSFASVHGGHISSRSLSNYGGRTQQLIGAQKGPNKEWKPKSTNPNSTPFGPVATSDTPPGAVEVSTISLPASTVSASEKGTSELQKKLEALQFSENLHVIIPNHLQVPEAERSGFSFGSFDAGFVVSTTNAGGIDTDKSSTTVSETSQTIEESAEELYSSSQNASPAVQEVDYSDHPLSPSNVQENVPSAEADGPTVSGPDYEQTKLESMLPVGGPQYSVVHTAPNYPFGLMPPILGAQFASFESSESQARDVSRLPSYVVQQPLDPASSYFPQFYRPSAEADGRFSPFLAPASAAKYNGNVAVLSPQSGQAPQEGGNSLVISTAGPTPLATQAPGVMQSSIAATQQSIPVFHQPAGVHLPHYPPNFLPYSQYFPPFYGPPPVHHFLSNPAFPQQPPSGSIFSPPTAAAATSVKYPVSQYKPGNTGSSTHVAVPTGYATYGSSPTGFSPSPAVTTGNSTGNEDLSASQYKDNNVYISGQQSEGSTVWVPSREISGFQTSSFYNLSPQGPHVTFAPAQPSHGAFAGIYHHPAQTVAAATVNPLLQQSQTMAGAVEMVGLQSGVYQQPQRAQINWNSNF